MSWKLWTAFFLGAIMVIVPMRLLEINPAITYITAFITLLGGYFLWWIGKNKALTNILEEKCDPLKFIEACEKFKLFSKRKAFQNSCNLNIAVGYMTAGQYDDSNKVLQAIDLDVKNSEIFRLAYHLACFAQYINTDEMEKATFEYENYMKDFGGKTITANMKYAVEASILEYNFKLNKNTEAAKYYLAQLDYLYSSYKTKISKRIRLNTLYNKACLEQEIGNAAEAIKKFKFVTENGNGLKIVEQSRVQLDQLENQSINFGN
ncbi:hypothetical protein [Lacrimispora sp.]|uniref:hypothetical protein n=1 Tax=Lacrimispora sp. TaxID=2719234 RepID=UPI0028ACD3D8|nr:hypothetical protein [Lacrimispora sp.]